MWRELLDRGGDHRWLPWNPPLALGLKDKQLGAREMDQQLQTLAALTECGSQHAYWAAHNHLYVTPTPEDLTPLASVNIRIHMYIPTHRLKCIEKIKSSERMNSYEKE